MEKKFQIITNIDFKLINSQRKLLTPKLSEVTPAHFINNVLEARADIVLSSHYGGDFYTSEMSSSIIRMKHQELLKRIGIDKRELRDFQDIVLDQAPTLREVLNSGERTFTEFLKLLDKSQKFREWTRGVNPDEKLVKSIFPRCYFRRLDIEITKQGTKICISLRCYRCGPCSWGSRLSCGHPRN